MATEISTPIPEHVQVAALASSVPGKEGSKTRIAVRITRLAIRSLDPDNLGGSVKALLDSLRDSGLIPDDDRQSIELQVKEVKVNHRREQGTLLEIIYS